MNNEIDFDFEKGFPLTDFSLKRVAELINGKLIGQDRQIDYLVRLKAQRNGQRNFLTYVTDEKYWELFLNSDKNCAIVNKDVFENSKLKSEKSIIVVNKDADLFFFSLHELLVKQGYYPRLKSYIGENCKIHPSAQIIGNAIINDRVVVDANVIIYPNTFIGSDSIIKAGTVIGGTGFEFKYLEGIKKIVSHSGGVYIGSNVEIGSLTAIDRDMMGYFTIIMDGSKIDNLIHIAHSVYIGKECSIIATSEISGSAQLGNGVWYAPHSCCNPEIRFGDYSFVGTGSVVVKDVPAFALVYGNPAKQFGWMCKCHKFKLKFIDNYAKCTCGNEYQIENNIVHLID